MMGSRKRYCVTRTATFTPTPISAIFWGQLRSELHQAGGHTTANLQPFTTLPLDIQVGTAHMTSCTKHFIHVDSPVYESISLFIHLFHFFSPLSGYLPACNLNSTEWFSLFPHFERFYNLDFFLFQSSKVESVRDALEQLVSKEEIPDYTDAKTNQDVTVYKQVSIMDSQKGCMHRESVPFQVH